MSKEIIGLNTFLYTFVKKEDYEAYKERLATSGTITDVFVNNKFAFEYKKNRVIKFR